MATTRPWFCPQTDCPAGSHDTYSAFRYGCTSPAAAHAIWRYRKDLRTGRAKPRRRSPVGFARRLQAAAAMGWSQPQIAEEIDMSERDVRRIIASRQQWMTDKVYGRCMPALERLAATPGPSPRARLFAERRGWVPALAWDDIDDPDEQPPLSPWQGEQIMELAGKAWPLARIADELGLDPERVREHLTETFTAEAARGLSYSQIADKFGVTITRVARQMRPVELEEIDPHLPSAVLDGSVSFNACSEREQLYVVEQLWPRVVAEDHENPTAELAAWLGVDPIRIVRIRATARKHARETKEAS